MGGEAAIARRWQRAIFASDRPATGSSTASGLCSDAVLVHAPGIRPGEARGPAAVDILAEAIRQAFAIDTVEAGAPIGTDDRVAIRWTLRGVHVGSYLGVAPTGRRVEIEGVDVLLIAAGRIVEIWRTYDRLALLRRLGAA
jgi:SnoaL-like polyketide cyclase